MPVLIELKEYLPLLNTILLFIAGYFIRRQRVKLNASITRLTDGVQGLNQQIQAVRETVETAPVAQAESAESTQPPAQPWDQFRSDWSDVRSRIELAINELDGRVRRKYGQYKRYNYSDIIGQLHKDDKRITSQTEVKLKTMNNVFLHYRTSPGRLSLERAKEMRALYTELDKVLPKPVEEQS